MFIIYIFLICFFYSYFCSSFLLNNPYDIYFLTQNYSSIDISLIRSLFDSFENNIYVDSLDLEKKEVNLETVANTLVNECFDIKKNILLSIFLLYDLSLVKEINLYSYLFSICINDILFLNNYFDENIIDELVINKESYVYLLQEYTYSLNNTMINLKNIDFLYNNSEFFIKNFINEIIK